MSTTKPFTFICGQDDYLVGRMGAERFAGLTADLTDEFAQETVNGFAANMGEVEAALNRFRESVQTVSMFGGKRVVWLKDVNFLADTVTGRAEGTLKLVEDLQELLTGVNPAETSILITASPVDRRRAFPKWCEKNADFALAGGDGDDAGEALAGVALAEAKSLGTPSRSPPPRPQASAAASRKPTSPNSRQMSPPAISSRRPKPFLAAISSGRSPPCTATFSAAATPARSSAPCKTATAS